MTDTDLQAVRERCKKATEKGWFVDNAWRKEFTSRVVVSFFEGADYEVCNLYSLNEEDAEADAQFIAHARDDIPELLTALDDAKAECERRLKEVRVEYRDAANKVTREVLQLRAEVAEWKKKHTIVVGSLNLCSDENERLREALKQQRKAVAKLRDEMQLCRKDLPRDNVLWTARIGVCDAILDLAAFNRPNSMSP